MEKLYFTSDYLEGAHPKIMQRLVETNMEKTSGYSTDAYCDSARKKICKACNAPDAEVHFLVGGTQTNAIIIKYLLAPYQGVISAQTGHIACHEAGAIEHGGHKVLPVPEYNGKLRAQDVETLVKTFNSDDNREHMVMPGMVYISQPTESGTLYSLAELEQISKVCNAHDLYLYVDGARLAYALACPENDVCTDCRKAESGGGDCENHQQRHELYAEAAGDTEGKKPEPGAGQSGHCGKS